MQIFGRPKRDPQQVATIKQWARELMDIPEDASLLVTELECHEEGCPPIETVVAVLAEGQPPRQWKVHRPVAEVTREDIETIARGGHAGIQGWRCPD